MGPTRKKKGIFLKRDIKVLSSKKTMTKTTAAAASVVAAAATIFHDPTPSILSSTKQTVLK